MRHPHRKPSPVVHDVDADDMELFTDDVMTTAMVRSAGGRSRAPLAHVDDEEATCVRPQHFVPAPPPRKSRPAPSRAVSSRSGAIPAASNSLTPMAVASLANSHSTDTLKLSRPKKKSTWVVTLGLAYAAIGAAAIVMLHARGAEKMENASVAQASQPVAAMALSAPVAVAPVVLHAPAPVVAAPAPVLQMPAVEMATAAPKVAPQKRVNHWKYVAPAPIAKKPEPKPEPKPAPVVEETRVAAKAEAPKAEPKPAPKSSAVADANALAEAQLGDGAPKAGAKKSAKQNATLATLNAAKETANDAL